VIRHCCENLLQPVDCGRIYVVGPSEISLSFAISESLESFLPLVGGIRLCTADLEKSPTEAGPEFKEKAGYSASPDTKVAECDHRV
jgi:hypothetical protein